MPLAHGSLMTPPSAAADGGADSETGTGTASAASVATSASDIVACLFTRPHATNGNGLLTAGFWTP